MLKGGDRIIVVGGGKGKKGKKKGKRSSVSSFSFCFVSTFLVRLILDDSEGKKWDTPQKGEREERKKKKKKN